MNYNSPSYAYVRQDDGRNILLPLLFGAAVGFPFGYIASNTNKQNQMPYYPMYQQPIFMPYPPYPYYPMPF